MDSSYERVRAAIIYQAICDYKKALRKRNGNIATLEQWFLSEWGEMLSGGHGVYIIEQCRKCVGMKPKREYAKKG